MSQGIKGVGVRSGLNALEIPLLQRDRGQEEREREKGVV